jgi:hypothetical protein
MTNDQLNTAAFVFLDELKQWKTVEFDHSNIWVIGAAGERHNFPDKFRSEDFIKQQAARALIQFYHAEMAKDSPQGAPHE